MIVDVLPGYSLQVEAEHQDPDYRHPGRARVVVRWELLDDEDRVVTAVPEWLSDAIDQAVDSRAVPGISAMLSEEP